VLAERGEWGGDGDVREERERMGNLLSKREAVDAEGFEESEAPATMRMALLTKRAKVKREMASSAIE